MSYFIVPKNKELKPIEIFKASWEETSSRNLPFKDGWFYMPATYDDLGRPVELDHLNQHHHNRRMWIADHTPYSTHELAASAGIFDLWCNR